MKNNDIVKRSWVHLFARNIIDNCYNEAVNTICFYLIVSINNPEMLSPSTDFAFRFVLICGNFDTPQMTIASVFKTAFIFEASILYINLSNSIHFIIFVELADVTFSG